MFHPRSPAVAFRGGPYHAEYGRENKEIRAFRPFRVCCPRITSRLAPHNNIRRLARKLREPTLAVRNLSDVEALERTPLEKRGLPSSTFALIAESARRYGDNVAFRFIEHGLPDDPVREMTYQELLARVVQAANLFHELGVTAGQFGLDAAAAEPGDVCLPARRAGRGHGQSRSIRCSSRSRSPRCSRKRAARCWSRPIRICCRASGRRSRRRWRAAPFVKHVLRIGGPRERGDLAARSFEAELDRQPADRLVFHRDHRGPTTSRRCSTPAARRRCQNSRAIPIVDLALHAFVMAELLDMQPGNRQCSTACRSSTSAAPAAWV